MNIADLRSRARVNGGYRTIEFPDQALAHRIVNPRRGAMISVPLANWRIQIQAQDELFSKFHLEDTAGCTTGEMYSRPIPQVFKVIETKPLTNLFAEWAPLMYERLLSEILPPIQTLNRTSRLGWPVFETTTNKKAKLQPFFNQMVLQGPDFMRDAFIIMNVRLQAESRKKVRDFLFVDLDGEIYSRSVDALARRINTPAGLRTASRTRLVFNLPVGNLLTQMLDTAVHNALLGYTAFSHNMYSSRGAGHLQGTSLFFDVRHFERHTSEIVRLRSSIIGGLYERISKVFDSLPFLCPSDDWRKKLLLWPNREDGWSDQFASGYSPVAPVQKEIFWALYAEFAVRTFHFRKEEALSWVLNGGDHHLRIINYGDDNVVSGDPAIVAELLPFLNNYLHVEEEFPPKFLGFLYTQQGWRLGIKSYLEKTYLNERRPGSNFRRYPCFGWVEKRKIYAQYGVPEIVERVYPAEEDVLSRVGLPWTDIIKEAAAESVLTKDLTGVLSPHWIQGKDWLMTPEEKIATGEFEGFSAKETAPFIKSLLGPQWARKLRW
jgi:hypothetical protein